MTIRVTVELWPKTTGKFVWPKDDGINPEILSQMSGPFGKSAPCADGERLRNTTFVSPQKPFVTAWYIFARELTPKNPLGWTEKPYPWMNFHVDISSSISGCKVKPGRYTKGFVIDSRYPKDCSLDLTLSNPTSAK